MKDFQKIILYYVDNNLEALRDFNKNFSKNQNYIIKTSTSVLSFYRTLRSDVNIDRRMKIVIIKSYIHSEGLNTNTAMEIVPMIKALDKNIEIITFSDGSDAFINPTKSDIRISDFIKQNEDFYIVLDAVITEISSRKNFQKFSKIYKSLIITLLSVTSIVIILLLIIYIKGQ